METESRRSLSHLLWVFLAGFAGVAVGAMFLPSPAPDTRISPQGQETPALPPQSVAQPQAVVDTQIARIPSSVLRTEGQHRFAVANAGDAVLLLKPSVMSEGLSVREFSEEIAPKRSGYIAVGWRLPREDARRPWQGFVKIQTNDVDLKVFHLFIAEEADDGTGDNAGCSATPTNQ
jgi:hypothetical protein